MATYVIVHTATGIVKNKIEYDPAAKFTPPKNTHLLPDNNYEVGQKVSSQGGAK